MKLRSFPLIVDRTFLRPAIVAAMGLMVVIAAIVINYIPTSEEHAPPAALTSAPASTEARPNQPPGAPSFDVVRINPQGDTVIAGRATPGATVVIRDGETAVGDVVADGHGEWVFVPTQPLPPGRHTLNLQMQNADGAVIASPDEVLVVVPKSGEDVAGRPTREVAQPLALRIPRDGGPATLLQRPSGLAGGPFAIETVESYEQGGVAFTGRAAPSSGVRLSLDGRLVGETKADDTGHWRILLDQALPRSSRMLRIEQLDANRTVVATDEVPFLWSSATAGPLPSREVVVKPGQTLWRIARSSYGHGVAYTLIYDANRDIIADPHLIYPGQVFQIPEQTTENPRP